MPFTKSSSGTDWISRPTPNNSWLFIGCSAFDAKRCLHRQNAFEFQCTPVFLKVCPDSNCRIAFNRVFSKCKVLVNAVRGQVAHSTHVVRRRHLRQIELKTRNAVSGRHAQQEGTGKHPGVPTLCADGESEAGMLASARGQQTRKLLIIHSQMCTVCILCRGKVFHWEGDKVAKRGVFMPE
jgi:hypothetical protein